MKAVNFSFNNLSKVSGITSMSLPTTNVFCTRNISCSGNNVSVTVWNQYAVGGDCNFKCTITAFEIVE